VYRLEHAGRRAGCTRDGANEGAVSHEPRRLDSSERFAALLAAAVALVINVAASASLFEPQSAFGYRLIYTDGFEVGAVDPATPAARAGIVAGDRLDFTRSTLHDRIIGLEYRSPAPGETATFELIHQRTARRITLTAAPLTNAESQEPFFSPLASFLRLAGLAYIVVALIILLRRTNRMTWGLFLYLVSATDVSAYRFPDRLLPAVVFAADLLSVAGAVGLVVFAVRFPNDSPVGWRATIDRLALPIAALFAIPNLAWDAASLLQGRSPAAWMEYGSTLGALALIALAAGTLVATYARSPIWERRRLLWVMIGIFFTLLSYASGWARYWWATYSLASSDAVLWIATMLYAAAPFAIAYAVVRQRVFDVSFVLSRTLVYTIVSATLFGCFALVEWLAGRVIEQSGLTIALVALMAIGVAFSLDAVYSRVENFVDRTLFRRRHQAERHLCDVAAGLPNAQNAAAVEAALIEEPVRAFSLAACALFVRDDDGEYCSGTLALDRHTVLQLQGGRRSMRLGEGAYVLAVAVFVRSRLYAVAAYGPHRNGEDIDPDEVASLEAIGTAAGVAYDHLESARFEREADRWRRIAERQARELAALRKEAHGQGTA